MAKRTTLYLGDGMIVESDRDFNGRYYVALARGATQIFRQEKELRRFLKLPVGTPSRVALDDHLKELVEADSKRISAKTGESLREELLATGFGPECHDVDNDKTRMII
ncbi:MAG: hypothetical protein ACO29V_07195 [Limnohabitans sp.]